KYILVFFVLISFTLQFKIDPSKQFILDKYGRSVIFHGVNVVYKLPPYIPKTDEFDPFYSLSSEDIVNMKKMGFNLVRLGVIWESVEIEEDIYDYEYLHKMRDLVNRWGDNGIYTIVDAHQDVVARNFCGEGIPSFYIDQMNIAKQCNTSTISKILGLIKVCKPWSTYNFRYDEKGLPLIEDCVKHSFVDYHFSPEMTSAYKFFFDNINGVQDKFAKFWQVVAKEFKGNEYVIGYDIWNEPFPGGLWDNLSLIFPNKADMTQAYPLYAKVDSAIREIDPNYILFFENMPFPDTIPLFGGMFWGRFKKLPASEEYPQVYNVHNYCCWAGPNVCNGKPEPDLKTSKKTCPKFHNRKVEKNKKDSKKLNVPLIVTEFGACSDTEACYNEIVSLVTACENNLVSWAYWNYKPYEDFTTSAIAMVEKEGLYNKDGTIQEIKERSLSRAYVQYYQGEPLSFNFINENTSFKSTFIYDSNIRESTTIYFNRNFFYKSGYKVQLSLNGMEIRFEINEIDENYITINKIDQSLHGKSWEILFTPLIQVEK
ncbi:MAG: cellulase family glycosylhydrolase, partial [Mycoplasma sp.]